MTHLTPFIEKFTCFATATLGSALLVASAALPSPPVRAYRPGTDAANIRAAVDRVQRSLDAPKTDYGTIASGLLLIGTSAVIVLNRGWDAYLKTKEGSAVGRLEVMAARVEMMAREHAAEIAYRDQRDADRERDYTHARTNRLQQLALLETDIKRLEETERHHVETNQELRRIIDTLTRDMADVSRQNAESLIQSTANTGRLLKLTDGITQAQGEQGPPGEKDYPGTPKAEPNRE